MKYSDEGFSLAKVVLVIHENIRYSNTKWCLLDIIYYTTTATVCDITLSNNLGEFLFKINAHDGVVFATSSSVFWSYQYSGNNDNLNNYCQLVFAVQHQMDFRFSSTG